MGALGPGTSGRTQTDRDAITVEITYALVSALFMAGVVFGATAGPALLLDLPPTGNRVLLATGGALAAVVFIARTVLVLWRFGRRERQRPQPSQPGLTNPDS